MTTKVDKVKISNSGGVFLAHATIHWGAYGSGPQPVSLSLGESHTWDLVDMGIPSGWGFWAVVHAVAGETVSSPKDKYIYEANTGVTVHYQISGSTYSVKIESDIDPN